MPGGRPPFYTSPEVMQKKIDEYFAYCDEGEEIEVYDKKRQEVLRMKRKISYTIPGLSNYLGFMNRHALLEYATERKTGKEKEFYATIMRAKSRIEQQRNEKALNGEQDPKFAQFDLKNNFAWKDQYENKDVPATVEDVSDELKARIIANVKGGGACSGGEHE